LQDELGLPQGTRPRSEDECRRVLAHHEAGHAVVGHVLGRKLHRVSVTQHCEFGPLAADWSDTDLENSIKIALAGPHAEVRASRERVSVGAGSDLPTAKAQAQELAGEAWKDRLEALSVDAQAFVMKNWKEIERVAGVLVQPARSLSARDLADLLKP
jgi:ATP-dependent Zn protease